MTEDPRETARAYLSESPEEEFLDDFGAGAVSLEGLARLLRQARRSEDAELRRLIREILFWRSMSPHLVQRFAELGETGERHTSVLLLKQQAERAERL